MFNFAHNGVVHETAAESAAHSFSDYALLILAVCAFAAGLAVVYFYTRKSPETVQVRNKNEKE